VKKPSKRASGVGGGGRGGGGGEGGGGGVVGGRGQIRGGWGERGRVRGGCARGVVGQGLDEGAHVHARVFDLGAFGGG